MKKLVSKQAISVYQVLGSSANAMTAERIADKLGTSPNAIYRSVNQLLGIGVVTKSKSYPVKFKALTTAEALPWYLLNAQKSFKESFGEPARKTVFSPNRPAITIVKDRDDFLHKTTQDALKAQEMVNLIVSGLEVPDETILTYRKIIAKGVRVRAIVQERKETSPAKLTDWKDIGAEVRYTSYMGLRLFVTDEANTYLVSYSRTQKELALGVRYNYPPVAKTMNDFFEQQWQKAKPLA